MPWNDESGNKTPGGNRGKNTTPPDLDEVIRNLSNNLRKLFSSKNSGKGSPSGFRASGQGDVSWQGFSLAVGLMCFVVWGLSGIFIVKEPEEAVILRFGRYIKTLSSGPHWIPRFIDKKYIVDVNKMANFTSSASMLTEDENIVAVTVAVQYRVGNAFNFLFNVVNPQETIRQATASAVRQVIGHTSLDNILTVGRETVRKQIYKRLEKTLALYNAGLVLTDVVLQPARPPEEVKAAFDDAIKAQEDEQRFINQADAYEGGVVPIAQGQAKRILQEAEASAQQVILKSKGDVAHFLSLLPEYQKAPQITRQRLYLETMENILSQTSKVVLDARGNNNMFYLPLDKLLARNPSIKASTSENNVSAKDEFFQVPAREVNPTKQNSERNIESYDFRRISRRNTQIQE